MRISVDRACMRALSLSLQPPASQNVNHRDVVMLFYTLELTTFKGGAMDFAKPLITVPNVASKAKIRYIALPEDNRSSSDEATTINGENLSDETLDRMVQQASNRAVSELILFNASSFQPSKKFKLSPADSDKVYKQHQDIIDTSLYPTHLLQHSDGDKILPNSLVVIFESFDSLSFAYATPGAIYSNRNGTFRHNDFIFKPYGCSVRSVNQRSAVYILKPTPELWSKTLNHRTQIIHESDASFIVFQLDLRPNMIVIESGTGSGAMSHAILRSIAPFGKLHTFEFNKARVLAAKEEFRKNGVDHMVHVYWRDVCAEMGGEEGEDDHATSSQPIKDMETIGHGGFNMCPRVAHAIFLDLPEPWLAIPHAAYTIVPNGRLCSYSPCIEQCHKTITAMKKHSFHSIQTFEIRLREYYMDSVEMEQVSTKKLPRQPNHNQPPWILQDESLDNPLPSSSVEVMKEVPQGLEGTNVEKETEVKYKMPPVLCARPFPMIKGHSAFLTFATASNTRLMTQMDK